MLTTVSNSSRPSAPGSAPSGLSAWMAAHPNLNAECADAMRKFLGAVADASLLAQKMKLADVLVPPGAFAAARPASAASVRDVGAFIDLKGESAERRQRCAALLELAALRPASWIDDLPEVSKSMSLAKDASGRLARLQSFVEVWTHNPAMPRGQAVRYAGFLGTSAKQDLRDQKLDLLTRVERLYNHSIPDNLLDALQGFVNGPRDTGVQRARLKGLMEIARERPILTVADVEAIKKFDGPGSSALVSQTRMAALAKAIEARPEIPADLIAATAPYLNDGSASTRARTFATTAAMAAYPSLDAATFERAVQHAKLSSYTADSAIRFAVDLDEAVAENYLRTHPVPPNGAAESSASVSMQALATLERDEAVCASHHAVVTAAKRRQEVMEVRDVERGTLFDQHRDRFAVIQAEEMKPHRGSLWVPVIAAAALGTVTAVASLIAAPSQPYPLICGLAAFGLGVFGYHSALKRVTREVEPKVERRLRQELDPPVQYWTSRVQTLHDLEARARDAATARAYAQAAVAQHDGHQPLVVTVDDGRNEVVIGGISIVRH